MKDLLLFVLIFIGGSLAGFGLLAALVLVAASAMARKEDKGDDHQVR